MFFKVIGWFSMALVSFSLFLGVVPGAMSIIGLLLSITALIISSMSVKSGSFFYLKWVTAIYGVDVFIVNDGVRVLYSLPQLSVWFKVIAYLIFFVAIVFYAYCTKEKTNKSHQCLRS